MLPTPQNLQHDFGIPAELGKTRSVPRSLTAYCGPFKREFLSLHIGMIVNEVLPQDGQKRRYTRRRTQDELAPACGLASRATFTHRLTLFRPDRFNAGAVTSPAMAGQVSPATGESWRGDATCDSPADKLQHLGLIRRQKYFGAPNEYNSLLPERRRLEFVVVQRRDDGVGFHEPAAVYSVAGRTQADEDRARAAAQADCAKRNESRTTKTQGFFHVQERRAEANRECYYYAEAEQLVQDDRIGRLFDAELADWRGFKPVPRWVWHPSLGISDTARLVLTCYIMCGLIDRDRATGKVRGSITVKKETVAQRMGMSIRTVYAANCELAGVGLIRIVPQKRTRVDGPDGTTFAGVANKIVYLPVRTMTDDPCPECAGQGKTRRGCANCRGMGRVGEIPEERKRRMEARKALHERRKALRRAGRLRLKKKPDEDLRLSWERRRLELALGFCRASRLLKLYTQHYCDKTIRANVMWQDLDRKLTERDVDASIRAALLPTIDPSPN